MLENCLTNLVGLTDKDCDCHSTSGLPDFDNLNKSESGFYLTDGDHGFPMLEAIFASIDCGDPNNVYAVLEKSRKKAIESILTDLEPAILKFKDMAVDPFQCSIGLRNANGYISPSNAFAGHLYQPALRYQERELKDVKFTVTEVWAGFNQTGTLGVSFASNDPDFELQTRTVNLQNGVMVKTDLSEPVEIPLWSKNVDNGNCNGHGLRYAVSYPVTGGLKPIKNQFSCCSGNYEWLRYIKAGGFETVNVDALLNDSTYNCTNTANGLVLGGYLDCDNLNWLCEPRILEGYSLQRTLARTIQYRSNMYLAEHVASSGNINYWTTIKDEETLWKYKSTSAKNYKNNILWMAQHMPDNATGCYTCKDPYVSRGSF